MLSWSNLELLSLQQLVSCDCDDDVCLVWDCGSVGTGDKSDNLLTYDN